MPGGDRTGPMGLGPRTGRAAGFCSGFGAPGFANPVSGGRGPVYGRGPGFWGPGSGRSRGLGFGPGRGRGRGPGWGPGWGPGQGYGRGFGPGRGRGRGPIMAYPEPVYPAYAYPVPYMSYYRPWW